MKSLNPYSNGMLTQKELSELKSFANDAVLILILMECLLRLKTQTIMETTKKMS